MWMKNTAKPQKGWSRANGMTIIWESTTPVPGNRLNILMWKACISLKTATRHEVLLTLFFSEILLFLKNKFLAFKNPTEESALSKSSRSLHQPLHRAYKRGNTTTSCSTGLPQQDLEQGLKLSQEPPAANVTAERSCQERRCPAVQGPSLFFSLSIPSESWTAHHCNS